MERQQSQMDCKQTSESPEPTDSADPKSSLRDLYPPEPRASFTPQHIDVEAKRREEDFFIFRPSVVPQAIQQIQDHLSPDEDGNLQSSWIMAQISHWGTELEVLAVLCDKSLLICYYDFVELGRSQLFRIPLNYIDTVTWGPLSYPRVALNKRDVHALQVKWDKLRAPPSFLSWWNPWTDDLSYINLIQHPGHTQEQPLRDMCQTLFWSLRAARVRHGFELLRVKYMSAPDLNPEMLFDLLNGETKVLTSRDKLDVFMERLVEAVKSAHERSPLPGRANGLLVLKKPVNIDTSLGLLSLLNSKGQLGYAKPRWGFGF